MHANRKRRPVGQENSDAQSPGRVSPGTAAASVRGGRTDAASAAALQRSMGNAAFTRMISERHQHGAGCGHAPVQRSPADGDTVRRSPADDIDAQVKALTTALADAEQSPADAIAASIKAIDDQLTHLRTQITEALSGGEGEHGEAYTRAQQAWNGAQKQMELMITENVARLGDISDSYRNRENSLSQKWS